MNRRLYIITLTAILATGCTNSRLQPNSGAGSRVNFDKALGITGPTGTTTNYRISNVIIGSTTAATNTGAPETSISFDSTGVTDPITNHCTLASGAAGATTNGKPCTCSYSWQEVNNTQGSNVVVQRSSTTALDNIQPGIVTCPAPAVYATEITDGTVIRITIVPSGTNPDSFTVTAFNYTKGTPATGFSFQDAEGHALDNIHRYSCYDQTRRGMKVVNKTTTLTSQAQTSAGETLNASVASAFCVAKFGQSTAPLPGCEGLPPADLSVQSYYYNLYIRNTDRGGINAQNDRFVCPKVQEALGADGTIGSSVSFWPMDTTFALALERSSDFPVGVEGFSRLGLGSADPSTASASCDAPANAAAATSGTATGASSDSLVKSCLGFAKAANADGTCPFFKDSRGRVRLTYRLRRFITIYPQLFDTDGSLIKQAPATDTIYVLDRPVTSPNANPTQPFTMRGPKPCPFSWYDKKHVLGSIPQYAATSYSGWSGTNVDGIEFPHEDNKNPIDGSSPTCSAVLPIVSSTTPTEFTFGTLNSKNPVLKRRFIRPINAFAPHYEEDVDFKACAPQADPMMDPPLHFSKDPTTGNVAWCAEAYPTQNDNVDRLDVLTNGNQFTGQVLPFTSHFVKNSVSPSCTYTKPTVPSSTQYPTASTNACPTLQSTVYNSCADLAAGSTPASAANHPSNLVIGSKTASTLTPPETCICAPNTCDRTVLRSPATGFTFPLLARATQVEDAIASDTTYGCTVTFDNGGSKTGKKSPTQGCCGAAVSVWTGNAAITTSVNQFNKGGHLEPTKTNPVPCLSPGY